MYGVGCAEAAAAVCDARERECGVLCIYVCAGLSTVTARQCGRWTPRREREGERERGEDKFFPLSPARVPSAWTLCLRPQPYSQPSTETEPQTLCDRLWNRCLSARPWSWTTTRKAPPSMSTSITSPLSMCVTEILVFIGRDIGVYW